MNVTTGHNQKMKYPPDSNTRQADSYRHGNLRNAALDEAAALIAARGGTDFSLREIAERLGVRHAALYRHFVSREALISTLAARAFERMRQRFEASEIAARGDAPALLDGLMAAYMAMVREEPGAYRMMFSDLTFPDPARTAAAEACFASLVNAFTMAQQSGIARSDIPALQIATVSWATLHGLAMLLLDKRLGQNCSTAETEALLSALCSITQEGWRSGLRPDCHV